MPAGENAVKGRQGFQKTEKPAADMGAVDVPADIPTGLETAQFEWAQARVGADRLHDPAYAATANRINAVTTLRSRLQSYEQHLVLHTFARKVRDVSPDVARVELYTKDGDYGRYVAFSDALDKDGNSVPVDWPDHYSHVDTPGMLLMSLEVDGPDVLSWDDASGDPYIDIQPALDDDPELYRP